MLNGFWGNLIIQELINNGIDYFVISPGSRSTPLTVAVARNFKAKTIVCIDERGAAFHALGYARATCKPAALICTSGTAAANYFPAIIEAFMENIPMIIIGADRPPELRQTAANQTINQFNLYGQYVKWQFDLPCPDEKIPPKMVLTTIDQAVYQSKRSPSGPIHLNCMFREPLAPTDETISEQYLTECNSLLSLTKPYTNYLPSMVSTSRADIQILADIINHSETGILAIGRLKSSSEISAVHKLIEHLNWPVFVDIRSCLRLGNISANIIHYFDQILLSDFFATQSLDTVIQIGDRLTSKRFQDFLDRQKPSNYVVILDEPSRHDSSHNVSLRIESNLESFSNILIALGEPKNKSLLNNLKQKSTLVDVIIDEFILCEEKISEPAVCRLISRYITQDSGLFIANSMPIRDMDMYAAIDGSIVSVAANRGTSGIEGAIASGVGFACGLNKPVTIVIGDLAFLHDLNSLSQVKSSSQPVIIVVINNDGGGIFSFLPIGQFSDVFEPYFGTPHQLNFKDVCQMFKINYSHPKTNSSLITAYKNALISQTSTVIEVTTNRQENLEIHKQLQKKISQQINYTNSVSYGDS